MENIVAINSLDDVASTLKSLLATSDKEVPYKIEVHNLPNFELYLKGEKFNNSLTPTVMGGIIELQQAIYRSYVIAKYGSDNLNKLTGAEKERLELKVVVTEGSTDVSFSLSDLAKALLESIKDMNTTQRYRIIMLILLLVGVGAGWLYYGSYLDHENVKIEAEKELNIEKERTKQAATSQQNILKAVEIALESKTPKIENKTEVPDTDSIENENTQSSNTSSMNAEPAEVTANASTKQEIYFKTLKPENEDLMAVIHKAKNSSPEAKLVAHHTEESMRKLIISTSNADFVRFNNQFEASGQAMKSIGTKQTVESEKVVLKGLFRILNIDTKNTEFMQARIRAVDAKYPDFNATFTESSFSKAKQNQLTTALTSYHPIDLSIEAKNRQGKLQNALITQVRQIDKTKSFKDETLET